MPRNAVPKTSCPQNYLAWTALIYMFPYFISHGVTAIRAEIKWKFLVVCAWVDLENGIPLHLLR